jgi:hypothetical protein
MKLKDDVAAGRDVRLNLDNAKRTLDDLQGRLEGRKKELQAMRHVQNGTPVVLGGALVVPAGLLRQLRGLGPAQSEEETAEKKRIEMLAMKAVILAEEARGCRCVDVSANNCGWDITSYPPAVNGIQPDPRHIEVKGRIAGATDVTVTRNEILYAFNQGDKFVLAIVFVHDDDSTTGPHYIRKPFDGEPGWGVSAITYSIKHLMTRAEKTPQ